MRHLIPAKTRAALHLDFVKAVIGLAESVLDHVGNRAQYFAQHFILLDQLCSGHKNHPLHSKVPPPVLLMAGPSSGLAQVCLSEKEWTGGLTLMEGPYDESILRRLLTDFPVQTQCLAI